MSYSIVSCKCSVVLVDDDRLLLLQHPRLVLLHHLVSPCALTLTLLIFTPSTLHLLRSIRILLLVLPLSRPTEDDLACATLKLPLLATRPGIVRAACCTSVCCCSSS